MPGQMMTPDEGFWSRSDVPGSNSTTEREIASAKRVRSCCPVLESALFTPNVASNDGPAEYKPSMKVVIISDIHGNLDALSAANRAARSRLM
jgi:hypothetical protein